MSHQHNQHSGGDHHDHEHKHDFTAANKEFFDNSPNEDNPKWIEMARRSAQAIVSRYPFDEETTTVLDFACSKGLLAREIAGHTKLLIGVDISQTVVDIFNQHVSNQGIPPEEMRAICVELKGEEGELDGLKFDVVTCAAAYHHFEDIEKITKTLAFFLKPGGVLFVVDISPKKAEEGGSAEQKALFPEKYRHIVPHHHGLSEEAIKTVFDGAGLTSFTFEPVGNIEAHEQQAILFVAKGVKQSA